MKDIKIIPYTVIALVAPENPVIFEFERRKIEPLFTSHKIPYIFSEIKLTEEKINQILSYPTSIEVLVLCLNTKEEVEAANRIADAHNFKFVTISIENHLKLKECPSCININLNEPYCLMYESDPSAKLIIDDLEVCVVGDIHGSFDIFKKMLLNDKGIDIVKNKIVITDSKKYVKHILVGDYIDKGDFEGIKKTIKFLANNLEHFHICIGNHEYWVAEYLNGNIKSTSETAKLIGDHFQTVILLLENEDLREDFFKIYNASFYSVVTPLAIINHAPCQNKYLYKEDEKSLRALRNFKMVRANDFDTWEEYINARDESLSFLKEEASQTNKYHIFGHTPIPEVFTFKNKICIDTGCVSGGALSTVFIDENADLKFKTYENKKVKKAELLIPYFKS